jgi:hypothetical protein
VGTLTGWAVRGSLLVLALACSPEAVRERDGGPGADPGNTDLVEWRGPDPRAPDTTLWPGKAPAPVDLLAAGRIAPPSYPVPVSVAPKQGETPITPNTPPTEPQQRTFDRSRTADPRRQSDSAR